MVVCRECSKSFKFLTERHLISCSGLTTAQYLDKHQGAEVYSEEWHKSVKGESNARFIDGRSELRKTKSIKCSECENMITGRGRSSLCKACVMKHRCPKSKLEKIIYEEIKKTFIDAIHNKYIKNEERSFYPDVVFGPNVIVEVHGDYWHAHPDKFSAKDVMKRGLLAEEIWATDAKRKQDLEAMGYTVTVIWEKDWKENKEEVLTSLISLYDWEYSN